MKNNKNLIKVANSRFNGFQYHNCIIDVNKLENGTLKTIIDKYGHEIECETFREGDIIYLSVKGSQAFFVFDNIYYVLDIVKNLKPGTGAVYKCNDNPEETLSGVRKILCKKHPLVIKHRPIDIEHYSTYDHVACSYIKIDDNHIKLHCKLEIKYQFEPISKYIPMSLLCKCKICCVADPIY